MFGSSNSNVKKLSALGAVLAIVLMSCGGSSSSSNANKSKNAVIDNGQCVLEADDVAARDASQADYDSASSTYDAAKSQAYDAYYQKVNELRDGNTVQKWTAIFANITGCHQPLTISISYLICCRFTGLWKIDIPK